jgi:hypothetical protein
LQPFGELFGRHDEVGSNSKSDSPQLIQATLHICDTAVDKENPQKVPSALQSIQVELFNLCRFEHASMAGFWKSSVCGGILRNHQA